MTAFSGRMHFVLKKKAVRFLKNAVKNFRDMPLRLLLARTNDFVFFLLFVKVIGKSRKNLVPVQV